MGNMVMGLLSPSQEAKVFIFGTHVHCQIKLVILTGNTHVLLILLYSHLSLSITILE